MGTHTSSINEEPRASGDTEAHVDGTGQRRSGVPQGRHVALSGMSPWQADTRFAVSFGQGRSEEWLCKCNMREGKPAAKRSALLLNKRSGL